MREETTPMITIILFGCFLITGFIAGNEIRKNECLEKNHKQDKDIISQCEFKNDSLNRVIKEHLDSTCLYLKNNKQLK